MTPTDLLLEQHYRNIGNRPPRKGEETITTFNRDIFWYDRDELSRQADAAEASTLSRITYEDHRKAIETAVNMLHKRTQHDIALAILTHRFFKAYRAKAFAGEGNFIYDYGFLVSKIGMIFNENSGTVKSTTIAAKLRSYTVPTLVQINHIAGTVKKVNTPDLDLPLNEFAIKFNKAANESTSYRVAGMAI
jgi:hypothetical protein